MIVNDLEKLNAAVEFLIDQKTFLETIEQLSEEIIHSQEPFVWSVIDLDSIDRELPESIKSCWIFVLKRGVTSGAITTLIASSIWLQSKARGRRRWQAYISEWFSSHHRIRMESLSLA